MTLQVLVRDQVGIFRLLAFPEGSWIFKTFLIFLKVVLNSFKAYMKLHNFACPVWAAHKNFSVLVHDTSDIEIMWGPAPRLSSLLPELPRDWGSASMASVAASSQTGGKISQFEFRQIMKIMMVINDGTASQTPPTVCVEFGFILIRNYPKDKCHNTVWWRSRDSSFSKIF